MFREALAVAVLLFVSVAVRGDAGKAGDTGTLAVGLLRELVEINTGPGGPPDATRQAAQAMAAHLVRAGFPEADVRVLGKAANDGNLVARFRSPSPSQPPILLLAHIDVVDALAEDWSLPPFELTEKDGYLYGRGSSDNKAGAAMLVANFIRLKKEGFVPNRDLIIVLSADEETTGANIQWLLEEQRPLLDAAFALNTDAGGVITSRGQPRAFVVQTSEKVYASFRLEARNPGGHSSLPRRDNAIYQLAAALGRVADYRFPIEINETTRVFFERWQPLAQPEERPLLEALAAGRLDAPELGNLPDAPFLNAMARTTCVATQLEGGHAENALPQTARATVNCRIVPTSSAEATLKALRRVVADPEISITQIDPAVPSPPSPLRPELFDVLEALVPGFWKDVPIVPQMSAGATDGLYVRNAGIPTYGVSAIAEDPDDARAHGQDERIGKRAYLDSLEFWYRMLKKLAG